MTLNTCGLPYAILAVANHTKRRFILKIHGVYNKLGVEGGSKAQAGIVGDGFDTNTTEIHKSHPDQHISPCFIGTPQTTREMRRLEERIGQLALSLTA